MRDMNLKDRLGEVSLNDYACHGVSGAAGVMVGNWVGIGVAVAQSSGGSDAASAATAICNTGLGSAITFAMGMLVVYLVIKTIFRAVSAFDKLGSTRSDENYEGKRQLVGAGQTLAGAFAIPIFGALLSRAGLPTLSCVDWSGVISTMPVSVVGEAVALLVALG